MSKEIKDNESKIFNARYDIESIAKILSLVAIPVVLAVVGWTVQNGLSERNLSQEYVKLAVTILEKPKSAEVPAGLRNWAVDLLNLNSPTKFNSETIHLLKTGEINLAGIINDIVATASNSGGIAVSPDGRTVATGQNDGKVAIWEFETGRLLMKFIGHTDAVTTVVYSPDATEIFSGSFDNSVIVWDLRTGQMLNRLANNSPVTGLVVSPDGSSLVVRSLDDKLKTWDIESGQLIREVQLTSD
jgi:WD40 repeat protein